MASTALAQLESQGLTRCLTWCSIAISTEKSELASKRSPALTIHVRFVASRAIALCSGEAGRISRCPFHDVINPPLRTSSGVAVMSEDPYYAPLRTHVLHWPR